MQRYLHVGPPTNVRRHTGGSLLAAGGGPGYVRSGRACGEGGARPVSPRRASTGAPAAVRWCHEAFITLWCLLCLGVCSLRMRQPVVPTCHTQRWMKHVDESRAAATATTALARDVGDGQRIVPSQYVPQGVVRAHGVPLEGLHSVNPASARRAGAPLPDQHTRSEDLDCYSGGGYQPAGRPPTRWCVQPSARATTQPLRNPKLQTEKNTNQTRGLTREGVNPISGRRQGSLRLLQYTP